MAILPAFLDVHRAVPVVSGLAFVACAIVLLRWWRHLEWREAAPVLVGEAIGSPLGVLGLVSLDPRWVKAALGALLLLYGVRALVTGGGAGPLGRARIGPGWGILAGLVGGVLGSAFNTGGPPLIVYATARGWSPGTFRANLQLFFLFNTAIQLAMLRAHGLFTLEVLRVEAVALPALVLGLWLGTRFGRRLDPHRFRRLVFGLLVAFGLAYLAGAAAGVASS